MKQFFSNDLTFFNSVNVSPFGKSTILNITKNLRKSLLIIHLKSVSPDTTNSLLNIDQLNGFRIKVRLPAEEQFIRGVIGPIGVDTPVDEIKKNLLLSYPLLSEVQRIVRGPSKIPTLSVKLTFIGNRLPSEVILGYQRFPVNVYIGRPWQCYNCQKFGHNANACRSRPVCATCSDHHKTADCPQASVPFTERQFKCANCQQAHSAGYGGCPNIRQAKQVEKCRAVQRLSYRDAVASVKNAQESRILPSSVTPPSQPGSMNPRNTPIAHNPPPQQHRPSSTPAHSSSSVIRHNVAVQTEPCSTQPAAPSSSDTELITKLSLLVVSRIQLKSFSRPKQINDIVKSIMGVDLPKHQLNIACNDNNNNNSLDLQKDMNEDLKDVTTHLPNNTASLCTPANSDPQPYTSVAESVKVRHKKTNPNKQVSLSQSPHNSSRRKPNKK